MKTIFRIIELIIVFAFISGLFFLLVNKTFIYEEYKTETMTGDGIPISRFMYFTGETNSLEAKFISILPLNNLNDSKNSYLDSLDKCLGIYYFDSNNNITITKYDVKDNGKYRNITIKYIDDNYCGEDYTLGDKWLYEYKSYSNYASGDITSASVDNIVDKVYNSKRVDKPEITDYESKISYKIVCKLGSEVYDLEFKDFNENELAVIKNNKQLAVYTVDNVVEYLKGLEKSSK